MITSYLTPSSAVVVASSSRSGSTWLADMLGHSLQLQQIFEPLHPKHSAMARELTGFDPKQDHLSSFYLRIGHVYPEWDRFLEAVLTGQQRNSWTDAVPAVQSARGNLVKLIRANLMLGYLIDRFRPKLIYLVRHPCAVVSSRLMVNWTASPQAFLKQEQLVEDYLQPYVSEIERETDPVGAHALCWAVENLVAQRQLSGQPHSRVFYEHLMLDTALEAERIAQYVGVEASALPRTIINRPSRMSRRIGADGLIAPLVSWKEELSQDDQCRILHWANRFGISWYDTGIWPARPLD